MNWRAYLYHMKAKHTESGGKRFACNVSKEIYYSLKESLTEIEMFLLFASIYNIYLY